MCVFVRYSYEILHHIIHEYGVLYTPSLWIHEEQNTIILVFIRNGEKGSDLKWNGNIFTTVSVFPWIVQLKNFCNIGNAIAKSLAWMFSATCIRDERKKTVYTNREMKINRVFFPFYNTIFIALWWQCLSVQIKYHYLSIFFPSSFHFTERNVIHTKWFIIVKIPFCFFCCRWVR